jgi:hypothetical protein
VKPDRRSTASTPAQSHRGTPWAIGVPASSPGARTSLQQSLLRRFPRLRLCSDVVVRPSRCTTRYNDGGQRDRCTVHCGLRESSSAPQPHPWWPPLASLCCFVSPPCFPLPPHPVADGLQHCLVTRARCSLHVLLRRPVSAPSSSFYGRRFAESGQVPLSWWGCGRTETVSDMDMPFGYPRISIPGLAHYGGGQVQGLED